MKKLFYSTFIFAALLTSCGGGEEAKENEESTDNTEAHAEETSNTVVEESGDISTKGNWNAADKQLANDAVAAIDEQLAAFGDKKQAFIDCYLQKVEANYASFAEADVDLDGCSALAESCAAEVMGM